MKKINKNKIISKIAFWLMLLQVMMVIWILILAVTWVVINKTEGECPGKFITEKQKIETEKNSSENMEQNKNTK